MSELFGHMIGVMILMLMATFIGIWIWAWRPRHKATFDALAAIPMQEHSGPAQSLHRGQEAAPIPSARTESTDRTSVESTQPVMASIERHGADPHANRGTKE